MANELSLSLAVTYAKGNAGYTRSSGAVAVTVTGAPVLTGVQNIPTSNTVIEAGAVAVGGYVLLHNADATNYIEVGETGAPVIKLKAGEWALLRWTGTALYAIANTGACNLEYAIFSD